MAVQPETEARRRLESMADAPNLAFVVVASDPVPAQEVEPRHYVGHLSAVAADQTVTVERTIQSTEGRTLASPGERLDPELVARLSGQKVESSLTTYFSIESPIDSGAVINIWSRIRDEHRDLDQLERRMGLSDDFETVVRTAPIPEIVWQAATAMFSSRPDWFQQAVLGSWFATALAREAGLVDIDVLRAFAAAFSRDLGFLFIDSRHIDRPGYLEGGTRAWRAIQGHVETGREIWRISDAPPPWSAAVGRAVFEHHERINGTGYPDRPSEDALDDVGQLVGMADLLASVRLRRFASSGRNIKDTTPLIMVSSDCFPRLVVDAAIRVLERSGLRGTTMTDHSSKSQVIEQLRSRAHLIRRLTQVLGELPSFEPAVPRGRAPPPPGPLTRAVASTVQMLMRSGSNQKELTAWLEAVSNGRSTARMHELCEMDLQQSEALWRVEQIRRLLAEHIERDQPRSNSPVHRVLTQLQNPLSL